MSLITVLVAFLGGLMAGIINTLAGNGSAITLTILTELVGLPGNIANATNRIGIVAQGLASTPHFIRHRWPAIRRSRLLIVSMCLGALFGAYIATRISNAAFVQIFSYAMILMLILILVRPERWLQKGDQHYQLPPTLSVPLFLVLGFYAGFIQMGVGVFFLIIMSLVARYEIIDANAVKNVVIFLCTLLALLFFSWRGLVDWSTGAVLAAGQALGGWWGGRFATRYENAGQWAYRLLIVAMVLAIIKLFFF